MVVTLAIGALGKFPHLSAAYICTTYSATGYEPIVLAYFSFFIGIPSRLFLKGPGPLIAEFIDGLLHTSADKSQARVVRLCVRLCCVLGCVLCRHVYVCVSNVVRAFSLMSLT